MITARAFAGKHYAVYGLARSGLATAEALLASGANVTAWDAKEEARAKAPAGIDVANLDDAGRDFWAKLARDRRDICVK